MRRQLLPLLGCPTCRSPELDLTAFSESGDHVIDGALRCGGDHLFWIVDGVPRLLDPTLYQPPEGWCVAERRAAVMQARGHIDADALADLKRRTIRNFGYQWTRWDQFGWTSGVPTPEEIATFRYKSLLGPSELAGRVALDAGCGNGRYTWIAAQSAREVVAVDLGAAVDSAFMNVGRLPNVHVIQADLFRPPLREGVIDAVFSIGVLMHTGHARRATERLASILKQGGSLTVHLYHRGNPVYELNDALLRRVTTRMRIDRLQRLSETLARLGAALERRGLLGYANLLLRLHADTTCNFDWYAAPIATHHTYPEVFGWFADLGFDIEADNRATSLQTRPATTLRSRLGRIVWRDWALTVKARKPHVARPARAGGVA